MLQQTSYKKKEDPLNLKTITPKEPYLHKKKRKKKPKLFSVT